MPGGVFMESSSRKVRGLPVWGSHRMGLEGTTLSGEAAWDFYTWKCLFPFDSVLPREIQFCALCQ